MNNNNNFLLQIHIDEDGKITEISLNKDKHVFIFENDECVSDFILPDSKVASLRLLLENTINTTNNQGYCVEYEKDGVLINEYDREKVLMLKQIVTDISVTDFLRALEDTKINDYHIDNITKNYNCKLNEEVKKILSYTINGATLNSHNIVILSHNEIINYQKNIKNFIPFILSNDKNYIGYDFEDATYKEYKELDMIRSDKNLKELMDSINNTQKATNISKEEIIQNEEKYEDIIKNIDYQFEKLSVGIKNQHQYDNEKKNILEEKKKIKEEIVAGVRKSLNTIEETNSLIDEIDNNFKEVKKEQEIEVLDLDDIEPVSNNLQHKVENDEIEVLDLDFDYNKDGEVLTEKDKEDNINLISDMITNSLNNALSNYKIDLNDTQKLVVEHLPYYEFSNSFEVIQIPEIEIDKITLLPDIEINLNKIKFTIKALTNKKVELLVKSATSIVDEKGNKINKGQIITLDSNKSIDFRLNKKNAMETWSIKMEKSTFKRELRNLDYGHIMNIITTFDSYKKLGSIEKYELEKSIMLFINFVMQDNDMSKLEELYQILEEEPTLYEEFVTRYNIKKTLGNNYLLPSYENKKEFMLKLNYINGLIDAKWLDYPRYIFATHDYFNKDEFLQEFISELDDTIDEKDFSTYLLKLFKEYKVFTNLDEEGRENLEKCLEYLSVLYKYYPSVGEENKYRIEKEFMIGADEEYMSLLISKLCRRGIKDYSAFVEYDAIIKEKYRLGELKYPIFSDSFGLDEIRNGGEYDEY